MSCRRNLVGLFLSSVFSILLWATSSDAAVYYAVPGGTGSGTSWTDGADLAELLHKVKKGSISDCSQIWVREGTYLPVYDISGDVASSSRDATFSLSEGTSIYGGFAGGESAMEQRDPDAHPTVLSGCGQSLHTVYSAGLSSATTLGCLTVSGGNSSGPGDKAGWGGGMYNVASDLSLKNCIFKDNYAALYGGAMYNVSSDLSLEGCTFTDNSCDQDGGAVCNEVSNSSFKDCLFKDNRCDYRGGGMCNSYSNSVILDNCLFKDNWSDNSWGGGLYNWKTGLSLKNCSFKDNYAHQGGAMYNQDLSPVSSVERCSFFGNSSRMNGGAVYNEKASPSFVNCTFYDNRTGSNFHGGGMYNRDLSCPTLANCTFYSDPSRAYGSAVTSVASSGPTMVNCVLWGAVASVYEEAGCSTRLYDSVVQGELGTFVSPDIFVNCTSADPRLYPLSDDDGDIWMCAVRTGGPAVDGGRAPGDYNLNGSTVTVPTDDQRGLSRQAGQLCDIGSYEAKRCAVRVYYDAPCTVSMDSTVFSGTGIYGVSFSRTYVAYDDPRIQVAPEEPSKGISSVILDGKALKVTSSDLLDYAFAPLSSDHELRVSFSLRRFTVSTSCGAGGTVSPDNPVVSWGDDLSIDVVPDGGYVVSDVLVDGKSVGAVTSYVFSDVSRDRSLSAVFRSVAPPPSPYPTPDPAPSPELAPVPSPSPDPVGGNELFVDHGGASRAVLDGTVAVILPEKLRLDDLRLLFSDDVGNDYSFQGLRSGDLGLSFPTGDGERCPACGVSFDVAVSGSSGIGMLPVNLKVILSRDMLSSSTIDAIEAGATSGGLVKAMLDHLSVFKVISADMYDLRSVAERSGCEPERFFNVSRDSSGDLSVEIALLVVDSSAGDAPAVQAVPVSDDCRFLIFDGTSDCHYRDPVVFVDKDMSVIEAGGSGIGCSVLPLPWMLLLSIPLFFFLNWNRRFLILIVSIFPGALMGRRRYRRRLLRDGHDRDDV